MRAPERIPVVLKYINWEDYFKSLKFDSSIINALCDNIHKNYDRIVKDWNNYPDCRLSQLLINKGLIPDGSHFYAEETDYILKRTKCTPEEIIFWGSYGKTGKEPLRMIAINDMETDHIKACLRTQKHMNKNIREVMEKVLNKRRKSKIKKIL